MSRRPIDVVQKAFDLWADLTPDQKKQFHWSMEGYNMARKEAIAANGGVEPDRVAPRTRQRKPKVNGAAELVNAVAREHESIQRLGPYSPTATATHPANPPKGGSGVPPKTA